MVRHTFYSSSWMCKYWIMLCVYSAKITKHFSTISSLCVFPFCPQAPDYLRSLVQSPTNRSSRMPSLTAVSREKSMKPRRTPFWRWVQFPWQHTFRMFKPVCYHTTLLMQYISSILCIVYLHDLLLYSIICFAFMFYILLSSIHWTIAM